MHIFCIFVEITDKLLLFKKKKTDASQFVFCPSDNFKIIDICSFSTNLFAEQEDKKCQKTCKYLD